MFKQSFLFVFRVSLLGGSAISLFWLYQRYGSFAVIAATLIVSGFLWVSVIDVPQRTAILIANIFGTQRTIGPGWNLIIPGFEWVDEPADTSRLEIPLEVSQDTNKNDNLTMKLVVGGAPSLRYLPEWVRFKKSGSPEQAIQNWCEGALLDLVHCYGKRKEIYRDRRRIAELLVVRYLTGAADGGSLESRYGFDLEYISVVDIVMPEVLREKELLKEGAVEEGKALAVSVSKAIREARKICRNLPTISEKSSFDFVMMDKGRGVSKTIHEIDTGVNFSDSLKDIVNLLKDVNKN